MTEAEWHLCEDPFRMVPARGKKISNRKLRLFAVGCCRRVWDRLGTKRQRAAVELAERFAEHLVTTEQFRRSRRAALVAESGGLAADVANYSLHSDAIKAALFTSGNAASLAVETVVSVGAGGSVLGYSGGAARAERRAQAALLRCIAGERYRLPRMKPAWRTDTVVALASQMYETRDFNAMPVLADALQDAGCDNAHVLEHCRTESVHARGCWVVDLILGKE